VGDVSSVTLWVCMGIGALVLCSLLVLLAWWAVVALVCHVGCRLLAIQNRHWRRPAAAASVRSAREGV